MGSPEIEKTGTSKSVRWVRIGWITALSVAAIAAVNAAGIWGIAVARRGTVEEADRVFRLETASRATSIESALASTRADLAFLAGSPAFLRLELELASRDPREARWRRLAAEGAMLLFLRGHPHVTRLVARSSSDGGTLVAAGRRGGVPVLWQATEPFVSRLPSPAKTPSHAGSDGPASDIASTSSPRAAVSTASTLRADSTTSRLVTAVFDIAPASVPGAGAASLEASLDVGALLAGERRAGRASSDCSLVDAEGRVLAGPALEMDSLHAERIPGAPLSRRFFAAGGSRESPRQDSLDADSFLSSTQSDAAKDPRASVAEAHGESSALMAEALVHTGGWTAPSPWRLTCARSDVPGLALVEPLAARYRLTLALNLIVMALGLLLGSFAIHQARRRQILEATSREESRVREFERRLFHAERLGTVGRLAAGIAHEINNPLEGMSNYLRLAREDLERGDLTAARRRLDSVHEGLERAAGIVRQVLAYAEPATAPHSSLDLNQVLVQSVEFVRSRGEFRAIAFSIEPDQGRLNVDGSPIMLGQVFLNLLLNACEAQPAGGEVSVRSTRSGPYAVAEIADRGPGVAPADRGRVFEPFYSTKHSTGLGLYIGDSIVRQHGGELRIEDQAGGGARFVVRLPLQESVAPAGGAAGIHAAAQEA